MRVGQPATTQSADQRSRVSSQRARNADAERSDQGQQFGCGAPQVAEDFLSCAVQTASRRWSTRQWLRPGSPTRGQVRLPAPQRQLDPVGGAQPTAEQRYVSMPLPRSQSCAWPGRPSSLPALPGGRDPPGAPSACMWLANAAPSAEREQEGPMLRPWRKRRRRQSSDTVRGQNGIRQRPAET